MSDQDDIMALSPDAKRELLARLLKDRAARGSATHALSAGQEALWFLHRMAPDDAAYHVAFPATVHGHLDLAALRRAWQRLVNRHDILRTTFEAGGGPGESNDAGVQRVHDHVEPYVDVVDVSDLDSTQLHQRILEAYRQPFDLARGPVARMAIFTRSATEHVVLITIHHIACDGWSAGILANELLAFYAAGPTEQPRDFPPPPPPYREFVEWQARMIAGPDGQRLREYWECQLTDVRCILDLPTDRPRRPSARRRGATHHVRFSPDLTSCLRKRARSEGVTLYTLLLAAFQALLHRYSGQERILVGSPVVGRSLPRFDRVVGYLINMIVLRADFDDDPTFRVHLGNVRDAVNGALRHADYPFPLLVRQVQRDRDPSRSPIFQVVFNLLKVDQLGSVARLLGGDTGRARVAGLDIERYPLDQMEGQFELALELTEAPAALFGEVRYDADLYEPDHIRRMAGHFERLLEAIAADPDRMVSGLPLLTDAEREALAIRPVHPFVEFPAPSGAGTIPDRFEIIVARHGARVAVESEGTVWTYRDLDARAGRVARAVQGREGLHGGRVGLLLPHAAPMVAAVLGVLRSGNVYVPLDPLYPRERLAFMLADAEMGVLVTDTRHLELARALGAESVRIVNLDELEPAEASTVAATVAPEAMAYILYTSGSTGQPKGVMQSHRNVLHHIGAYTNNLHIAPEDRVALLASFSFDAAVMDLFGALLNGTTLCLRDVREHGIEGLADWLERERITIYHSTPTLYRALLGGIGEDGSFPDVRLVVLGGEEVVRRDVELYRHHFAADCLFVNGLGPTESTVSFQQFIDRSTPLVGTSVPVGFPVTETELVLLDGEGRPAPLTGEIGIRSPYVALGYWRRPELTAAAFRPDPEGGERRIYRTGDLGRLRPDGALEFLGRRDDQVKVRGFRIEPAEVESVIDAHPGVRRSVVVAGGDRGERYLAAYVIPRSEPGPEPGALQSYLRQRLPSHMVPSVFVTLDAFPLTPSGKVDRRALPTLPDAGDRRVSQPWVAPRTALEEELALMWKEVLRVDRVGAFDDFFDLGGHSLLAMSILSRINARFAVDLPLRRFVEVPTVDHLARDIETLQWARQPYRGADRAIERVELDL